MWYLISVFSPFGAAEVTPVVVPVIRVLFDAEVPETEGEKAPLAKMLNSVEFVLTLEVLRPVAYREDERTVVIHILRILGFWGRPWHLSVSPKYLTIFSTLDNEHQAADPIDFIMKSLL